MEVKRCALKWKVSDDDEEGLWLDWDELGSHKCSLIRTFRCKIFVIFFLRNGKCVESAFFR